MKIIKSYHVSDNSCIDNCQNHDIYKYEYESKCYLLDEPINYCDILDYSNYLIKTIEKGQTYITEFTDSLIIIKPLTVKIENSTVDIDFSQCEKKLKESNPEKEYRILQINMGNKFI